jgi:Putative prokaryotic signal transducing protein
VDDDAVVVKTVASETEADIACGLLRSAGIECGYRETDAIDSTLEDFTPSGPREILVHGADLEAARELLDSKPEPEPEQEPEPQL